MLVLLMALAALSYYYLYIPTPQDLPASVAYRTLAVSGRIRSYLVYCPPDLQPGASLLLAFHPSASSAQKMRSFVGVLCERIARRDNVIIVYPDGYEGHFNDCRRAAPYSARTLNIDDVGFTRAIVARFIQEKSVDPARVYALGFSNGAQMTLRLTLEAPELVRGVISICAHLPVPENLDCVQIVQAPRRVVFISGTKDPVNPYGGGKVSFLGLGNRGKVLSARASAEWFADLLNLTKTGDSETWTGHHGQVSLITLRGYGHTIPQARFRFPRVLGRTYRRDDVLESAWAILNEPDSIS